MRKEDDLKRALIVFLAFAAIIVQILFMQGLRDDTSVKENDKNNINMAYVENSTPDHIISNTTENTVTINDELISNPVKDEFNGIVYQGYIYKDLRENEWGWNLYALCGTLGVNIVSFEGEDFIQVCLSRDTFIYKYRSGELIPVFAKDSYQEYLCAFKGCVNRLEKV